MKAAVTITDVARTAGVSIQTVSRVLNQSGQTSLATRQRVQQAIEQLGYRPNHIARGLATNRTFTLGLIVPDITNPFFPDIVRGAEQVALEHGYTIFLCNTNEQPEREMAALTMLEAHRVDGIILCGSRVSDEQLFPHLGRHRAVVLINRQVPFEDVSTVRVDYAEGTRLAVSHLQASQRGRIGFLSGPLHSSSRQTRLGAFSEALAASGTPLEPSHILACAPTSEAGYESARALLTQHSELDGLLCYNDLVAIGALHACTDIGRRVPDTLAVVGYDDIPSASLVTPSLTTVGIPKSDLGAHAVDLLLKRIAGDQQETELVLSPQLIVRASAP